MDNILKRADNNLIYTIKSRISNIKSGEFIERDGYIIFSIGVSSIDGHLSGGICIDDSKAEEFVEEIFTYFKNKGFGFSIWVKDHDNAKLEGILKNRGLTPAREKGSPIMVCRKRIAERQLDSDFYIKRINKSEISDFKKVIISAFNKDKGAADLMLNEDIVNLPSWKGIVIYDKSSDLPVAVGTTVTKGDTAGIYYIATLEEYRGRGLGSYVATAATNIGFDSGADVVVLQASTLGERVYSKLTYETIGYYRGYKVDTQ